MSPWFRVKIANFSRLHCLAITKRDFSSKKTKPYIEKCPESLGVISNVGYCKAPGKKKLPSIRSIVASWIYTFILSRSPIFITLMVCFWVSSLKNRRWFEQFLFKLCRCFCLFLGFLSAFICLCFPVFLSFVFVVKIN